MLYFGYNIFLHVVLKFGVYQQERLEQVLAYIFGPNVLFCKSTLPLKTISQHYGRIFPFLNH